MRTFRFLLLIWGDHVRHGTNADVYNHFDLFLTIAALLHATPQVPEEANARPIGGSVNETNRLRYCPAFCHGLRVDIAGLLT